jgi:hypothetical protein
MSQIRPMLTHAEAQARAREFLEARRAHFGGIDFRMDATGDQPDVSQRPDGVSEDAWNALGDPGKAAIVRERSARTEAEQARAAAEQRVQQYGDYEAVKAKADKYDQAMADAMSEQEKAVAAARSEGESAARTALTRERVLDKIEVASAGKFRDIEDARLRLGQRADEFVKDGQIDTAAIAAAVDKVLEAAPHLKADIKGSPRPDPSQGPRGGDTPLGEQGRTEAQRRWGARKQ